MFEMKLLSTDFKRGKVKVRITNLDDLWHLSHIIDKGDLVRGKTLRKVKIGKEEERSQRISKKAVFLEIKVESVEFHKYSNILRVSGTVENELETVQKGSYHTFNVEENSIFEIVKEKWYDFQIDKLKEASKERALKILICILDREEALFALVKGYGYEHLSKIKGDVQKKGYKIKESKFYFNIVDLLKEYSERYDIDKIIVASPAFWKDELMKIVESKSLALESKIILATCSSINKTGINEVLKRPEIKKILKDDRVIKEINFVEDLLAEISKDNLAAYGFKEVKKSAEYGAVNFLLIVDDLIHKLRREKKFNELDEVMKTVEKSKGEIHIISSEHEGGKKLSSLGGIGAILRYKIK